MALYVINYETMCLTFGRRASLRKNSSSGSHWLSSTIVTLTYVKIVIYIIINIINIIFFVTIIILTSFSFWYGSKVRVSLMAM